MRSRENKRIYEAETGGREISIIPTPLIQTQITCHAGGLCRFPVFFGLYPFAGTLKIPAGDPGRSGSEREFLRDF